MRGIEGEQVLMRIFIGESDRWKGRPLADAIVEELKREGFAGATVLRGVQGFGAHSKLHRDSILRLSQDLPMIIEVIDTQEHMDAVLPKLDEMLDGGIVTFEKVRVVRYQAKRG